MNIENKVKVTICGKEYNLRTDESPEYLTELAARLNKEINALVKAKPNFGIQNAAVFVALTALDEAHKASESVENVGAQIKAYLTETAKVRREKERVIEKNKALEEKIAALENEIKELKKRSSFECEQLVLENTISPAVTIYAKENEAAPEPDEKAPEAAERSAESAECGSDASTGGEVSEKDQHGGTDGGAGTEAENDGGSAQDDNLTAPEADKNNGNNKKNRKKRH